MRSIFKTEDLRRKRFENMRAKMIYIYHNDINISYHIYEIYVNIEEWEKLGPFSCGGR